jgi:uncharacterized metal-binding protein YceD (DUF177 family)
MTNKRDFEIAFVGLKPGVHEFVYELDEQFFLLHDATEIIHPAIIVKLFLEKNNSFMMLKFEVGGKVNMICDRCGNGLPIELWDEFKMIVKLVENPEEMNEQEEDPDVFYISRTESHLNVEDWLYEFSVLSIPNQRMCSPEQMGGPQCNKEVLEKLKKMESDVEQHNASSIWKDLEKFKKN